MSFGEDTVRAYFDRAEVVEHYSRATANLGLWNSEELVFKKWLQPSMRILELGTGTGRIAIGLYELGFPHVLGIDISRPMVQRARLLAEILEYSLSFQVGNATGLEFEDSLFDAVVFGFNGLMQIPEIERRARAIGEIWRVLSPGGLFIFTTHDRDHYSQAAYWDRKGEEGNDSGGSPFREFGDRFESTELGELFIHVPDRDEVLRTLRVVNWHLEFEGMRSEITMESHEVREFSDDCRFWVVRKVVS